MMGLFKKDKGESVDWKKLESEAQLTELMALSKRKPVAIFKHSTRCLSKPRRYGFLQIR